MKQKTLSISGINLAKFKPIRRLSFQTNTTHTDPPESTKNSYCSKRTPLPLESEKNASNPPKTLQKRPSGKKLTKVRSDEDLHIPSNFLDSLDSFENCRKVFEKIIKKDKRYGEVLGKIKEVYEREIRHVPKVKSQNALNLNLRIIKKVGAGDERKSEKGGEACEMVSETEVKSTRILDTLQNTVRGNIPELNLESIQKSDFHGEFMANFDKFSESWRKLSNK